MHQHRFYRALPQRALRVSLAAAALATVVSLSPPAYADGAAQAGGPATRALSDELAGIAARVGRAVVAIRAQGASGRGEPAAAGVIVSEDGFILTAAAAVPTSSRLEAILPSGRAFSVRELVHDEETGLVVLQITNAGDHAPLPFARLGDPQALAPGAIVATLGNPFRTLVRDGQAALSLGVVSAVYRMPDSESGRGIAIETDAAINPGSFGGPLVDCRGDVVGIVVPALRRDRWLGLAAPADDVQALLARARRGARHLLASTPAKPKQRAAQSQAAQSQDGRGVLGIFIFDDDQSEGGAKIVRVKDGSPAARAGLKEGDVVRKIDGKGVASSAALATHLKKVRAGQTVELTVERDGWARTFELTAAAAEPTPSEPRAETPAPEGGRPYLGVALDEADGLFVGRVVPDAPAGKAGIETGDKLVSASFGGKTTQLTNAESLLGFLKDRKPGEEITMIVERDGWKRELTVTLGSRPGQQARRPERPAPPQRVTPPSRPQAQKKPGFLGAYLRNSDAGLAIDGVVPGSAAETAGLRSGDVIANVDGRPVENLQSFTAAMRGHYAGDEVEIGIKRSGATRVIGVTLGERPQSIPPREQARATPQPQAQAKPGYLGAMLEETDEGLLVAEVIAGSPADSAGLKAGWFVSGIDGNDVDTIGALAAILKGKKAGDTITLKTTRRRQTGSGVDVQVRAMTVTLGERPSADQGAQSTPRPDTPAERKPGFLGISVEVESGGLTIVEIVNDSPAAKAGLRVGERLTAIDGVAIRTIDELAAVLRKHYAGDEIHVTLAGAKGERKVTVKLSLRPSGDS